MKFHKTISINADVNELLSKEKNASALIEKLLRKHYKDVISGEKKDCEHSWSIPGATPAGLMKECILCGKTEIVTMGKE